MSKVLIDGIPAKRLSEICRAEQEGRLVVLPCKVGDTIFVVEEDKVFKCEVVEIKHQSEQEHGGTKFTREKIFAWCKGLPFFQNWSDIGKTAFLTREAAEQALEKEKTAPKAATFESGSRK